MTAAAPRLSLVVALAFTLTGCDRFKPKNAAADPLADARKAEKAGDFPAAVTEYENALGASSKDAEIHFRLGVIYDQKLKKPESAMHHYRRYLELTGGKGPYSAEAALGEKASVRRHIQSHTQGAPLTQEESRKARDDIKRQTESYERKIADLQSQLNEVTVREKGLREQMKEAGVKLPPREQKQKPIPPGAKTHVVKRGETLASIAHFYFKNKAKWKNIQEANFYQLDGTATIKPGQTLIIPEK